MVERYIKSVLLPKRAFTKEIDTGLVAGPAIRKSMALPTGKPFVTNAAATGMEPVAHTYIERAVSNTAR